LRSLADINDMIRRQDFTLLASVLLGLVVSSGCLGMGKGAKPFESAASARDYAVQQEPSKTKKLIGERRFHEGDIVILRVVPGKEFEKELELTVGLQGEVLVPLIGWVDIEGLTIAEAEEKIRGMLDKDYIVDPRVTVRVKEAKTRGVVLLGELKKPGTYDFPPSGKMTLLEAVAKAEGFTDIADLSEAQGRAAGDSHLRRRQADNSLR
jgi:protein involved in polysaccharide export with SLBB domain